MGAESLVPELRVPLAAFAAVGMGALFDHQCDAGYRRTHDRNEMTGATTLPVPAACASALAVPALLGSRPIYDTLRDRDAARRKDSTTM